MPPTGNADYAGWTAPTSRITLLADELADALDTFDAEPLRADEIRRLLDGMSGAAAALTRILDQLGTSSVLTETTDPLGLPSKQTMLSELAQAAAAAEDLTLSTAMICRRLPQELSTVDRATSHER